MLGRLAEWAVEVVYQLGYFGIGLLILLENLIPPIPSEVILPLAGYLVSEGRLTFAGVVGAATVGSVLSALLLYALGAWLGEARLRALLSRHGRKVLLKSSDVQRADLWFDRHGGKAVFVGRFIPGIRSIISLPAGLVRMPLGSFILYTTLGSLLWNGVLVFAGWQLGARYEIVAGYVERLQYVVVAAVAIGALWFFRRRWLARRARRSYEAAGRNL